MENQTIRLECHRNDGRWESAKLEDVSLAEAHELAERVLQIGNGFYMEVEICADNGYTETVRKNDPVGVP